MSKSAVAGEVAISRSHDEYEAVLHRATQGDDSALPLVRVFMQAPGFADAIGGNLARRAEESLIKRLTGDNLLSREAIKKKMELLRNELSGPNPTVLEELLVERVVVCWLQVYDLDVRIAYREDDWEGSQAEYHQRSRDRAHRRYLSSIKTLATVRKLALPVLQVNIAKQQVNVAGGGLP